jgi:hypothetical protein
VQRRCPAPPGFRAHEQLQAAGPGGGVSVQSVALLPLLGCFNQINAEKICYARVGFLFQFPDDVHSEERGFDCVAEEDLEVAEGDAAAGGGFLG